MSQIIHVPDEMYVKLAAYAAAKGQTIDDIADVALQEGVKQLEIPEESEIEIANDNPFFQLAGFFASGVPDLGANHDHYLAEAYGESDDPQKRTKVPFSRI